MLAATLLLLSGLAFADPASELMLFADRTEMVPFADEVGTTLPEYVTICQERIAGQSGFEEMCTNRCYELVYDDTGLDCAGMNDDPTGQTLINCILYWTYPLCYDVLWLSTEYHSVTANTGVIQPLPTSTTTEGIQVQPSPTTLSTKGIQAQPTKAIPTRTTGQVQPPPVPTSTQAAALAKRAHRLAAVQPPPTLSNIQLCQRRLISNASAGLCAQQCREVIADSERCPGAEEDPTGEVAIACVVDAFPVCHDKHGVRSETKA